MTHTKWCSHKEISFRSLNPQFKTQSSGFLNPFIVANLKATFSMRTKITGGHMLLFCLELGNVLLALLHTRRLVAFVAATLPK